MMPFKQVDLYWCFEGTHWLHVSTLMTEGAIRLKGLYSSTRTAASNFRSSNHTTVNHVRGIVKEHIDRMLYLLVVSVYFLLQFVSTGWNLRSFLLVITAQNFLSGWGTGPGASTEMWNWFVWFNTEQVQVFVNGVLILGIFIRSGIFWSSWATIHISRKIVLILIIMKFRYRELSESYLVHRTSIFRRLKFWNTNRCNVCLPAIRQAAVIIRRYPSGSFICPGEAIRSSIVLLSSDCDTFYYILIVQLFLQPQFESHKEERRCLPASWAPERTS
jgi:hypothetical protein